MRFTRIILAALVLFAYVEIAFSEDSKFSPENPNAFTFKQKSENLQRFGYDKFCTTTKTFACNNRLPYEEYYGMKGYFISMEPVKTHFSGHEFREVELENGKKFFYVSNPKYGGPFSRSAPIIRLSEVKENESLVGQPIATNSNIKVVSIRDSNGVYYLKLSNEAEFRLDQYNIFKRIAENISDDKKRDVLSKTLPKLHMKYDKIDDHIRIRAKGLLKKPISAYVVYKNKKPLLGMEVRYTGKNWLFVKSYIAVADNHRYESSSQKFKRDHARGTVWEWTRVSPDKNQMQLLNKIADAKEVTVRFEGNKYISDNNLDQKGIANIKRVLEVNALLK